MLHPFPRTRQEEREVDEDVVCRDASKDYHLHTIFIPKRFLVERATNAKRLGIRETCREMWKPNLQTPGELEMKELFVETHAISRQTEKRSIH